VLDEATSDSAKPAIEGFSRSPPRHFPGDSNDRFRIQTTDFRQSASRPGFRRHKRFRNLWRPNSQVTGLTEKICVAVGHPGKITIE
jgi:hypothetical protein